MRLFKCSNWTGKLPGDISVPKTIVFFSARCRVFVEFDDKTCGGIVSILVDFQMLFGQQFLTSFCQN